MLSSLSERVPYDAIVDRPPLKLPGGARLAVWLIVNIESWEIKRPMPGTVLPPPWERRFCPISRIGHGMNMK